MSFVRNVLSGPKLFEVNPIFEEVARNRGFYSKEMVARVESGYLRKIKGIPPDVKRIFVTAFDVTPEQHLQVQAAFQRYSDNTVSKTNQPAQRTMVEDVRKIYLLAYRRNAKGITVYSYGSKEEQVVSFGYKEKDQPVVRSDNMVRRIGLFWRMRGRHLPLLNSRVDGMAIAVWE